METLALRLEPVPVAAGELLFSQGDAGDRFYVVAGGRLEVVVDGRRRTVLGDGEGFGEIALVRECPRTATVRALAPGQLLALDRQPFLSTVVKHPRAGQAAGRIVNLHLEGASA